MAQVLSVLALSTNKMKEGRFGGSIRSIFSSMAEHHEKETFVKTFAGRTDVEDALQRLEVLTEEENLMAAARNLEVTHDVNGNVIATQELTHRVDDKVTTIEAVIHDVDGDVQKTKELIRDVHDDVKVIRDGA